MIKNCDYFHEEVQHAMRVKQGNLIYVGRVRECLNMEAILKLRTLE